MNRYLVRYRRRGQAGIWRKVVQASTYNHAAEQVQERVAPAEIVSVTKA